MAQELLSSSLLFGSCLGLGFVLPVNGLVLLMWAPSTQHPVPSTQCMILLTLSYQAVDSQMPEANSPNQGCCVPVLRQPPPPPTRVAVVPECLQLRLSLVLH